MAALTAPTQSPQAEPEPPPPPRATIVFMAVAVGAIVANIYYIQPLLADLARAFHITATGAGAVAMLMQLGTTGAMLGFVPLGDVRERRSLITTLVAVLAAALAGLALAPSLFWLCVAGVLVGASGSGGIGSGCAAAPPPRRRRNSRRSSHRLVSACSATVATDRCHT